MDKLKINKIIERMRVAIDVDNDVKLAKYLGYKSTGTISQWRIKKDVPDKIIVRIAEKTGVSFEWLKTGEDKTHPVPEQADQIRSVHNKSSGVNEQPPDPSPAQVCETNWLRADQQELLTYWENASEEAKEYAHDILKKSAFKSRENVGGGLGSRGEKSA